MFATECDQDKVDKILHIVQEIFKGTNSLTILDVCASSQDVKNRTSELAKLAFSARHYSLSIIVITQQLRWVDRKKKREKLNFLKPIFFESLGTNLSHTIGF